MAFFEGTVLVRVREVVPCTVTDDNINLRNVSIFNCVFVIEGVEIIFDAVTTRHQSYTFVNRNIFRDPNLLSHNQYMYKALARTARISKIRFAANRGSLSGGRWAAEHQNTSWAPSSSSVDRTKVGPGPLQGSMPSHAQFYFLDLNTATRLYLERQPLLRECEGLLYNLYQFFYIYNSFYQLFYLSVIF